MTDTSRSIVYHYCGVDAFQKILTTKTLLMSDAYYMDDYMEHRLICKKAVAKLDELRAGGKSKLFCDKVNEYMRELPLHPYVTCFSRLSDSLSQWRAFSDDGAGFAIGFSMDNLRERCGEYSNNDRLLTLESVEYDAIEHDKTLTATIEQMMVRFVDEPGVVGLSRDNLFSVFTAYLNIMRLAAKCKNDAFKDESECRIVCTQTIEAEEVAKDKRISELLFRVKGKQIIPYYTFMFKPADVTTIMLGPRNQGDDVQYAIRRILRDKEYGSCRVELAPSNATYG